MSVSTTSIEQLTINTIRTLSMDGVQRANSGHPGTPMALAPVSYALWSNVLRFDPGCPNWPARDRFVLSCGHASMLLYSLLHLAGVRQQDEQGNATDQPAISLEDIKNFRQLGSPCAGHPEFGGAPGIETTTGPLGQGIGNSVGMAISAKWLAARYNRPGFELFENDVYALCSDGDLMEGIGCEAASLAGHLKLSNLCWIYDDNKITIEGCTDLAFSEDVAKRFEGLGWNTVCVTDANDLDAMNAAFQFFKDTGDRPTLIVLQSIIGFGSPNKANSHAAHGAPLGDDEIRLTKEAYGWPADERFLVPEEAAAHFSAAVAARGKEARQAWQANFSEYEKVHNDLADQLKAIWSGNLPTGWDDAIPTFPTDDKGMASRASSGKVLNAVADQIPWLLGGSADLAPSNNTMLNAEGAGDFGADNYGGRNMHFGIREHTMAAACNGMSLSGLRPYCGTFFVFTDYMRPSMRLASMMHQPVIYVLTHDSIGLGEDGPTHQPVEHLAACRAIPGLRVMRPADANEVAEAYRTALAANGHPTAMVLTRQGLPTLDRQKYGAAAGVARGGYILADTDGQPDVILMGTGSEISICLEAHQQLTDEGVKARVVSMPCCELFDEQDQPYRDSVLPPTVTARVAVEAGIRQSWDRYLGMSGRFVGMASFGASGPLDQLYDRFGITPANTVAQAKAALAK
ncbi:MAG: transketolase [Pirellulaceae bacterium]|nr:transketolase [Pirellulaceae bacterium]MDP7302371.1 transketolase [Pirellulaceae bacterium]HJN07700.1 transketolase [Pirellulaceae bacterium]